ncbi:MAG: patatin-like phospholipase family protein [Alphaproteobacteria bacterium]|nr:patatin-like phospholipase family protein [Alphaproteobacteria bacterium]
MVGYQNKWHEKKIFNIYMLYILIFMPELQGSDSNIHTPMERNLSLSDIDLSFDHTDASERDHPLALSPSALQDFPLEMNSQQNFHPPSILKHRSHTQNSDSFSPMETVQQKIASHSTAQEEQILVPLSKRHLRHMHSVPIEIERALESRVLSIDGGGIKGLMVLEILALLERKTGKHTTELFDMIGGTSAGALIATLITIKDPRTQRPKYNAGTLRDALIKNYPNFFKTKWNSCCQIYKEKYKISPVRKILSQMAGDAIFGDAIIPVFVTAFNVSGKSKYHKLSVLSSYSDNDKHKTVVDVALSSMSAPAFFKPHESSDGNLYLDGGLVANNPSLIAYCEAKAYFTHASHMVLLSMGAGSFADHASSRKMYHTGLLDIGPSLPDMFLLGQQSITQQTLYFMPDVTHFRVDPVLEGPKIDLDDTSKAAMHSLSHAGLKWWGDHPADIDQIVSRVLHHSA